MSGPNQDISSFSDAALKQAMDDVSDSNRASDNLITDLYAKKDAHIKAISDIERAILKEKQAGRNRQDHYHKLYTEWLNRRRAAKANR